jgi:negative regulator of flagellin synthesis FlgM
MIINNDVSSKNQSYSLGTGESKSAGTAGTNITAEAGSVSSSPATSASVVSLSPASQAASTASASRVQDSAPFDSKKVEQIKAAITRGEFQVNTAHIADSLMVSVRGLFPAGSTGA